MKAAYDQKLSEYNRWLNQQAYLAGQYGANPAINRQTERQELKKHCIQFITSQRFESFDAHASGMKHLRTNVAPFGYPKCYFAQASAEGGC